MPTLLIYFNLPCGSFPLLTHRTCLPGFLLFSPQFYISFLHDGFVSPNILFSRYFTSLLPAFPCYAQLYIFFSRQRSVPPSRAALLNRPNLSHYPQHLFLHLHSLTPPLPFLPFLLPLQPLSPPLPLHWDPNTRYI